MIRYYGKRPFSVAVLHGGPGAPGSVKLLAENLSDLRGVIEPFQSKYTVEESVDELAEQLDEAGCTHPVALVGHSWGAVLALLFAAKYPKRAAKAILVGCPPLTPAEVPNIAKRRLAALSPQDGARFLRIVQALQNPDVFNADALLNELKNITEKTDNVALSRQEPYEEIEPDGKINTRVWSEVEKMRNSGELLDRVSKVSCPVSVLHGEQDPHPAEGVNDALLICGVPFSYYLIPDCGHSPFLERASAYFYKFLRFVLQEECAR